MSSERIEKKQTADARQLPLGWPEASPRYDRDDFALSESNRAAWLSAQAWMASDEPALLVCGPQGAGKTHLAHALASGHDPVFLQAEKFASSPAGAFVIVDNLPAPNPRAFLEALESHFAREKRAVLVGAGHPSEWALGLKDLSTRLEAMPRAVLHEPDEPLIRAVIAKGFRDRQLSVSPAVVDFAALRLPRTFSAAHAFVALADRAALEEKRKITTPFVQKLLANLSEDGLTAYKTT